ncbi:GIN domain-containing protein, partial [Corallococcus llansteffanensis]
MWKRWVVGVLAAGLMTSGCYYTEDLRGDGNTVTEARIAEGFLFVENQGSLDVVVREGEVADVQVTIDANLQSHVRTYVKSGETLVIETDGSFSPTSPARVEVRVPRMVGAIQDGSGTLRVEGFEKARDDVRLVAKGSGALYFCGGAHTLDAKLSGSGNMELCTVGEEMAEWVDFTQTGSGSLTWSGAAKLVRASTDGSGHMTLKGVTNRLTALLDGSGNLQAQALKAVDVSL